jgi:hypothetical protein
MSVTAQQYYCGFIRLRGAAAWFSFLPALIHLFIPDSSAIAAILYPPLGDIDGIAVTATIAVLLISTWVVFTRCRSSRKIHRKAPVILALGVVLGFCALVVLYVLYVRRVPVLGADLEVPVSIGYQRTEFAQLRYSGVSDVDMLQRASPTEEAIQKLWTRQSIITVRILLWSFYTLTATCFLSVVSFFVYQHAAEDAKSKSKTGVPGSVDG